MIVSRLQNVWHTETEPGDGTHYSFTIVEYNDEFIIGNRNSFPAPSTIYKNAVRPDAVYERGCISQEDAFRVADIAQKYECNACTVIELLRIIQGIMEGDKQ